MGMARAFFFVAGGEGDFEFARGEDGVFEEELVEIAEAEEQEGVGDLLFDGVVLPHQRRGGVGGHGVRPAFHGGWVAGVDAGRRTGVLPHKG